MYQGFGGDEVGNSNRFCNLTEEFEGLKRYDMKRLHKFYEALMVICVNFWVLRILIGVNCVLGV